MGVNNQPSAQASAYASNPQAAQSAQTISNLQKMAVTPYQGTAAGGGAAQGVAQLVAALLARQKQKQWQQQYGINNQTPQPGMAGQMPAGVTPTPDAQAGGDDGT